MKKITLLLLFFLLSSIIFSEEKKPKSPKIVITENKQSNAVFTSDVGSALTFETGDNLGLSSAFSNFFNMFKVGVYVDGLYNLNNYIGLGVELGFYAFTIENTGSPILFDLPVLGIVQVNLFDILKVKGHFGYTFSSHTGISDSTLYVHKFDLGARFFLGDIYVDYSKLMWAGSKTSTKWGIGYAFITI